MRGDNIRAHDRSDLLQRVGKVFRHNGRILKRRLQRGLIGFRNAERCPGHHGIPEAVRGVRRKAQERFKAQGFFQRLSVVVRRAVTHDNAHAEIFPLCPERFLNAAVRTFQVDPVFHEVALKFFCRPAVQTGSAGKGRIGRVRQRQVF